MVMMMVVMVTMTTMAATTPILSRTFCILIPLPTFCCMYHLPPISATAPTSTPLDSSASTTTLVVMRFMLPLMTFSRAMRGRR